MLDPVQRPEEAFEGDPFLKFIRSQQEDQLGGGCAIDIGYLSNAIGFKHASTPEDTTVSVYESVDSLEEKPIRSSVVRKVHRFKADHLHGLYLGSRIENEADSDDSELYLVRTTNEGGEEAVKLWSISENHRIGSSDPCPRLFFEPGPDLDGEEGWDLALIATKLDLEKPPTLDAMINAPWGTNHDVVNLLRATLQGDKSAEAELDTILNFGKIADRYLPHRESSYLKGEGYIGADYYTRHLFAIAKHYEVCMSKTTTVDSHRLRLDFMPDSDNERITIKAHDVNLFKDGYGIDYGYAMVDSSTNQFVVFETTGRQVPTDEFPVDVNEALGIPHIIKAPEDLIDLVNNLIFEYAKQEKHDPKTLSKAIETSILQYRLDSDTISNEIFDLGEIDIRSLPGGDYFCDITSKQSFRASVKANRQQNVFNDSRGSLVACSVEGARSCFTTSYEANISYCRANQCLSAFGNNVRNSIAENCDRAFTSAMVLDSNIAINCSSAFSDNEDHAGIVQGARSNNKSLRWERCVAQYCRKVKRLQYKNDNDELQIKSVDTPRQKKKKLMKKAGKYAAVTLLATYCQLLVPGAQSADLEIKGFPLPVGIGEWVYDALKNADLS